MTGGFKKGNIFVALLLLFLFIFVNGCSRGPVQIHYGEDVCDWCGMTIVDPRYASEIITATGKAYKFDSIECMASFYLSKNISSKGKAQLYVSDFANPKMFIPAERAIFVKSPCLKSPMAANIAAFKNLKEASVLRSTCPEKTMDWSGVLVFVRNNMKKPKMMHMHMK